MTVQLLIPAAGMGVRLGGGRPKALVEVCGEALIVHTLRRFLPLGLVDGAVITTPPEDGACAVQEVVRAAFPEFRFVFVAGGADRQASVANGLGVLEPTTEIVVIHDAARPFILPESVQASIEAAAAHGAATVAMPSADTILVGDAQGFLQDTPDRARLWACQTPQTFQVAVIRLAHSRARREGFLATDDATLARRAGFPVKLVMGSALNFKVTTAADLALAACVLKGGLV